MQLKGKAAINGLFTSFITDGALNAQKVIETSNLPSNISEALLLKHYLKEGISF